MARNGSGTYSKVNTFVAGNSITAAGHNQNWDDLVAEVTNSVAADGQTTMTGQLKAANGTVAAPGISFGADLDCGLYRIGANEIGVAVNGAKVLDVATTGLTVTGALSADSSIFMPAGAVISYAGSAVPTGWLACDGSSVLRATYPNLFTAIGTTHGAADGSHFSLPDLRGRVIAGFDTSNATGRMTNVVSAAVLGNAAGTDTHQLTLAQLASHSHGGSTGGQSANHTHAYNEPIATGFTAPATGGAVTDPRGTASTTGAASADHTHSISSAGSDSAHPNVQPTMILNYIIKT